MCAIVSSTVWSFADLKRYIRALPENQHGLLRTVESMDRSTTIFRYHLFTARDALKGLLDESQPSSVANLKVVLRVSDGEDVSLAYTVSEAHLISCIHSVRASADIFSNLVNGLLLGHTLKPWECQIHRVTDYLPVSPLRDQLQRFKTSHWFRYISAFINTAKHRQLVEHSVSVSFVENRVGARVGAFEYDGASYQAAWVHDVLEGLVEAKKELLLCGIELNRACGL